MTETIRSHCGVCGEKGNHGDVPHSEAVASRFRGDERLQFVAWLKRQQELEAGCGGEVYLECFIGKLIKRFKKEHLC